jgi:hypothetical protein
MVAIRTLAIVSKERKRQERAVSERSEGSKQSSMRRRSSRELFGSANNGNPADTSQPHALVCRVLVGVLLGNWVSITCCGFPSALTCRYGIYRLSMATNTSSTSSCSWDHWHLLA